MGKQKTPKQLELLLSLYESGIKVKEIAAQTGINSSTISKTAAAHGLPPRIAYRAHTAKKAGEQGSWYVILEVKPRAGRANHRKLTHKARCNHCGSERWYPVDRFAKQQSCGCKKLENRQLTRKANGAHFESTRARKSVEYQAWCNMKAACKRSKGKYTFHSEWAEYRPWLAYVGRKPHPLFCFTRLDHTKHWVPGNVQWLLRSKHPQYDITDHRDKHVSYPKPYQHPYKVRRIPVKPR